ncbi:hypothetical protein [uncultured Methanobrevibacter sp.]|uniref:hypothetical protein n=1 Tax=uncultured Methanobrevibacter sp. TaxID=253161 RepID=UPI0025FCAA46|nr:hypothetical protein [uncultured Methanobrevibacter sp.]
MNQYSNHDFTVSLASYTLAIRHYSFTLNKSAPSNSQMYSSITSAFPFSMFDFSSEVIITAS